MLCFYPCFCFFHQKNAFAFLFLFRNKNLLFVSHYTDDPICVLPLTLTLSGIINNGSYFSLFLDRRLNSEDVSFNGTLTTPTPPRQICVVGNPLSRPSPIECNLSGTSRGRIPITCYPTRLHGGCIHRCTLYFYYSVVFTVTFDTVCHYMSPNPRD